ncbi:MAG: hypothetical protein AMQ22_00072 [Candidatus Methanofastidiosum methylothiophilum]|uniref:Uncharacterized protein n=1 Tax=Candidatus Methanofastidiosum methylothiophilum TaxID=1705564 RepID=A0A150J9C9_9EURY|nr:MAG: hypothetical protein AMQ22_00072 [Candidatus Methanofastidiosum methylthiophilus]
MFVKMIECLRDRLAELYKINPAKMEFKGFDFNSYIFISRELSPLIQKIKLADLDFAEDIPRGIRPIDCSRPMSFNPDNGEINSIKGNIEENTFLCVGHPDDMVFLQKDLLECDYDINKMETILGLLCI